MRSSCSLKAAGFIDDARTRLVAGGAVDGALFRLLARFRAVVLRNYSCTAFPVEFHRRARQVLFLW